MGIFQVPHGAEGWHEDQLIVTVIHSGITLEDDVWEAVHSRQSVKMAMMRAPPHSRRNFLNRIKSLIDLEVIYQVGKELALTDIGNWIAHSKLLDQDERLSFVDTWMCGDCNHMGHIVVRTPLLETIKKTSSGIRSDAKCPSCGETNMYFPTPTGMDIGIFVNFYNEVIDDLRQYAKISAVKIDASTPDVKL